MNSEVRSYSMNDPMSWNDFKRLPKDLKIEYIKKLRSEFDVPNLEIAKFMEISPTQLSKTLTELGLGIGKEKAANSKRWYKSDKASKFYIWLGGNTTETEQIDVEEVNEDVTEPISETVKEPQENVIDICEEVHEEGNNIATEGNKHVESTDGDTCYRYYSYYRKPIAVPDSGDMEFDCNADDALEMLKVVLGNKKVNLRVSWYAKED